MQIQHPIERIAMPNEFGRYTTEASAMGFPAGAWPIQFNATLKGDMVRFRLSGRRRDVEGDITHVDYAVVDSGQHFGQQLRVFND